MAAAGHQAEEQLQMAMKKHSGKFICVVEGAIPTKFDGGYGKIAGRTFLEIAKEVCPKAAAVIGMGACSTFGGIPAAPNPGGYVSVGEAVGVKTNISRMPAQSGQPGRHDRQLPPAWENPGARRTGRPLFAYGKTIHDQCPRRGHFENDEFVEEFGSEEAALGYCLYKVGCKGPDTYNNCPIAKFNDGTSWPIEAGHPCIGCSEPHFWDGLTPFYEEA